ncbi:hypothetical protein J2D73_03525 [Acetobacter sacchari]|uniref:Uncharacterized protein n=1 Tax=Acetobacter sacchari TaxID=2661687 RepID=A0ABS3LSJ2_9PROT|nr:hypothetical protein [Acetobacter sacchari]MBO1358871.1 hypothetical protein [Acetobacter sacchari]
MEPQVHIAVSDDRTHATVAFTADEASFSLNLSRAQLASLITALGAVNQTLGGDVTPSIEGAKFTPVRRTSWAVQPDVESGGSILAFQHPAYGPLGFTLLPKDAERLAHGLQLHKQLHLDVRAAAKRAN